MCDVFILPVVTTLHLTFQAIERAHVNMKLSTLFYTQGEISNANINRSPTSYMANPEEERNQYSSNTDHTMVQLNIFGADDGKPRGRCFSCKKAAHVLKI